MKEIRNNNCCAVCGAEKGLHDLGKKKVCGKCAKELADRG